MTLSQELSKMHRIWTLESIYTCSTNMAWPCSFTSFSWLAQFHSYTKVDLKEWLGKMHHACKGNQFSRVPYLVPLAVNAVSPCRTYCKPPRIIHSLPLARSLYWAVDKLWKAKWYDKLIVGEKLFISYNLGLIVGACWRALAGLTCCCLVTIVWARAC